MMGLYEVTLFRQPRRSGRSDLIRVGFLIVMNLRYLFFFFFFQKSRKSFDLSLCDLFVVYRFFIRQEKRAFYDLYVWCFFLVRYEIG